MRHIALVTRHFPELVLAAMEGAIQEAKALDANGPKFTEIADEIIAGLYDNWDSDHIITEVASQVLHHAVEQGSVVLIKRVIAFRNAYLIIWPEDAGLVLAAIDEHIPTRYQLHLKQGPKA